MTVVVQLAGVPGTVHVGMRHNETSINQLI